MIDLQDSINNRALLTINQVGVKGVKHPMQIELNGAMQHVQADITMLCNLDKTQRGTHMSRFLEILHLKEWQIQHNDLTEILSLIQDKLQVTNSFIEIKGDFFIKKTAPISGTTSFLDYKFKVQAAKYGQNYHCTNTLKIPVTTLCPCSKEISKYGAHNQRSQISLSIESTHELDLPNLIHVVEQQASCELYGTLKRADEKYVTEKAFENAKFVEDIVRDIYQAIANLPNISNFSISAENFESIHNHSAFAYISSSSS